MPSSLHYLRAAPLYVFSERSTRRAGAPGAPGATGATGSAWIRRNRRESLTWEGRGREAADKGELCESWEWGAGGGAVRLTPGDAVPPVASRRRQPAPQGDRLFYKNLKQPREAEPLTAAGGQGAAVRSARHSSQRFLIPRPLLPSFFGWETPCLLSLPPGTSGCFFRVAWEPWPDR